MTLFRIFSVAVTAAVIYLLANAPAWSAVAQDGGQPRHAFPVKHMTRADLYRLVDQRRSAFPK